MDSDSFLPVLSEVVLKNWKVLVDSYIRDETMLVRLLLLYRLALHDFFFNYFSPAFDVLDLIS